MLATINLVLKRLSMALITGYRWLISPLLGPHCRFHPSCSQYALTALDRFGGVKGLWLTTKRVCRCHPGSEGGVDPVPELNEK